MCASNRLHGNFTINAPPVNRGCEPPEPSLWHFALLGVVPGSPLEVVEAAYDRLARHFDPCTAAPEHQRRVIAIQDAIDEAMALINDAATWGRRAA